MEMKIQLIPNLIVIDKEWLETEIERTKNGIYDAHLVLKSVLNDSYPLSPIMEDAAKECRSFEGLLMDLKEFNKQYLSQPIKLVK